MAIERKMVSLMSWSSQYREWETTQEGHSYTIVEDNGEWSLLSKIDDDVWIEALPGQTVEWLLDRYSLVLG